MRNAQHIKGNTTATVLIIVACIVVGFVIYKSFTKMDAPGKQLTGNQTQTPMTTREDGLAITIEHAGSGAAAKKGDTLSMNYTGSLENGTVFDSNVDPKFGHVQPFEFHLGAGEVIKGWDEGLVGMQVGEKRKLVIPAAMAYGSYSPSPLIPANSNLVFEVELLGIK